MGWDAYATKGKWSAGNADIKTKFPDIYKAFKSAHRAVLRKADTVDGFLEDGGLDVSDCGQALAEMTNWGVYSEEGWTAKMVKGAWDRCKGYTPDSLTEPWAFWSAYYFLKTCAENNLGISFSY